MITADIKDVPPRRVAYLRGLGRYPQTLPGTWKRFAAVAGPMGLLANGGTMTVVHDAMGTVPDEQLRGDAAVAVGPDWQPAGGLDVQVVPGGTFAVTTHRGAYDTLPQTWGELYRDWLPTSGYRRRAAACYEVYENDPTTTPAADLLTTIYVAVERV